MDKGWIKLYRILISKPIWRMSTPKQKVILITLMLMANHTHKEWEWKGKSYSAGPGQFITSLNSIMKFAGEDISIQNVRSSIRRFERYGFLTNHSTNRNRLVTLVNWREYQERTPRLTNRSTYTQQGLEDGWVKFHKVLFEKDAWKKSSPEHKVVLTTVLLMANTVYKEWLWEGKVYSAEPGQFVATLNAIKEECGLGVSIQNVRTAMRKLERLGFLTSRATKYSHLVTVVNWGEYQEIPADLTNRSTSTQQSSNRPPTDSQQLLKNNKNNKNNKKGEDDLAEKKISAPQPSGKNIDFDSVIGLFHEKCPSLPKVLRISKSRREKIKARLEEMNHEVEMLEKLFKKIEKTPFLKGENKRGWVANFDWVFENDKNWIKVLEGNYDSREKNKQELNVNDLWPS